MFKLFRCIALVALSSLSACSGWLTDPSGPGLASAVQGQWIATQTIPGNYLGFTLSGTDTTITGTGSFAGEAGPSGTVSLTGGVTDKTVTLHLVLSATVPSPSTINARFAGTLDGDRLIGSIKYGPEAGSQPEYAITFTRIIPR